MRSIKRLAAAMLLLAVMMGMSVQMASASGIIIRESTVNSSDMDKTPESDDDATDSGIIIKDVMKAIGIIIIDLA